MKKWIVVSIAMCLPVALALVVSCGGDSDSNKDGECNVGALDCACAAGACNAGLECVDDVCVEPAEDTGEPEDSDEPVDTNPTNSTIAMTVDAENNTVCATGTVVGPQDNNSWDGHWGAGVGLDLCKPDSSYSGDKVAIADCEFPEIQNLVGFKVKITGQVPPELRIQFEDDLDSDNGYIVVEQDALDEQVAYYMRDATVEYLGDDQPELDPKRSVSIQFQVASHLSAIEDFDFCIEALEVIVEDEAPDAGDDDPDAGAGGGAEVECTPESTVIDIQDGNWVEGCTNVAHVQGHWFQYSDGQ